MMKNKSKFTGYAILAILIYAAHLLSAQTPVRKGPASEEEITKARKALDADMHNLAAHKTYIYAMGIINPAVVEQYRVWMKEYPDNVIIPLSIGTVFYNAEMPAKEFLLKVAEMEPDSAKIWYMLSADAFRWGRQDLSTEYQKKAALAEHDSAGYAMADLDLDADPEVYKKKVFEFVNRFPGSEMGAMALYWLGEYSANIDEKINYFEQLRKLYSPQKFYWSSTGMVGLADAYLQTDLKKAFPLIREMGESKDWGIRKQIAELLIHVDKLEQDKNYKRAFIELDKVVLPRSNYIKEFILFKKAFLLEKAGEFKPAYDSLAARFAKVPTDLLYSKLELYGKEAGMDKGQVDKNIDSIRNSAAIPAYPFELGFYTSEGKLNLKDLKGKVVLLTFWFPACGPCRSEFPHFQTVINKFKEKDVVYVGINVMPEQDAYIITLLQNTKYSFIPLRGSSEFAAKFYGVHSEPSNFLIDKEGRIIFKSFSIDGSNLRTLELMISSLLKKDK